MINGRDVGARMQNANASRGLVVVEHYPKSDNTMMRYYDNKCGELRRNRFRKFLRVCAYMTRHT